MQIIIKTIERDKLILDVEPNITVATLKEIIHKKTGIYITMIRLIFRGYSLIDERTLDQYGIINNSVVYIILQLR